MKRFFTKLIPITVALLLFGIILLGAYLELPVLTYLGVGLLFGGGFLLAIVCVVIMFVRARKMADKMDDSIQGDGQNAEPNAEEQSYPKTRYDATESAIAYSIHGYRNSTKKNKILSILFLTSTLGSVFAGLILLFFEQFIAAYVCFGLFAGILIVGVICAVIASKIVRSSNIPVKIATVVECEPVPYSDNPESGEPLCYIFLLEIDEKRYRARHFTQYERGSKVAVRFFEGNNHPVISDLETEKLYKSEESNR